MKKFLLLATLAASMVTAKADDFSQYFKVTCDGTEYTNGQTVTIDAYFDEFVREDPSILDDPSWDDSEFLYTSEVYIDVTNVKTQLTRLNILLNRTEPSLDEYPEIDGNPFGFTNICYGINCYTPGVSSEIDVKSLETLSLHIKQADFKNLDVVKLKLDLSVTNVPGAEATFYITFTHQKDITLAVDKIEAAEQPEVYFNLQGIRVTNPEKGNIYVVRKGSKVYKKKF